MTGICLVVPDTAGPHVHHLCRGRCSRKGNGLSKGVRAVAAGSGQEEKSWQAVLGSACEAIAPSRLGPLQAPSVHRGLTPVNAGQADGGVVGMGCRQAGG